MAVEYPYRAGEAICIVAAMESELRHALAALDEPKASTIGPWNIWYGCVDDVPVVLLLSGVGMANAASALTALFSTTQVSAVINYGCSGSHSVELLPGDVVIGSSVVAATSWTILPDGDERYGGFLFTVDGTSVRTESLEPHRRLLAAAMTASETVKWPTLPNGRTPQAVAGAIASGDSWTQFGPRIERLHAELGSLCEEMEAAALAQVCAIYHVPFLAVKDISNNELLTSTPMGEHWPTLDEFVEHLGETAFAVVRATLREVAEAGGTDGAPKRLRSA